MKRIRVARSLARSRSAMCAPHRHCSPASACSQLVFLKPPSVPRKKGTSSTTRGPAFAAQTAQRAASIRRCAIGRCTIAATTARASRRSRRSPPRNVATLAPACTFPLGEKANLQSGIVAVDGTLYFTTAVATVRYRRRRRARCAGNMATTTIPKPPFDPNKVNRGARVSRGPRSRATLSRSERRTRDGARSRNGRGAVERRGRRSLHGRDLSCRADRVERPRVHGQRRR